MNANSKRQQRLAELNAKMEAGVTIQRGRPVVEGSARQARIADLEEKRANGELKLGRPANAESKRQQRLADLELRRANGTLKLGRPKKQT